MSKYSHLVERAILKDMIEFLVARGYNLDCVFNGLQETEVKSFEEAATEAFATDASRVYFKKDGKYAGNVLLVLGNGTDVISDWSWPKNDDSFGKAMDEFCKTIEDA